MKTHQKKQEATNRPSNEQIVQKKLDEVNEMLRRSDLNEFLSKMREKK